jgi:cation:H+ antiporter
MHNLAPIGYVGPFIDCRGVMESLLSFGLLVLGGAMLYLGAEWLVKGAAGLAHACGVSSLVVGLTVVSYGTSAPELAVSMLAALEGRSPIALGNVVGSNIANIGLILGLTALITPPRSEDSMARRELPIMIGATAALPLVLVDGVIGRFDAALFLLSAIAFTYATLRWSEREPVAAPESMLGARKPKEGKPVLALLVGIGLLVLSGGGKAFVAGAVGIALQFGMSERVVGLTIVAVGTSLPELAASLVAALRGHSALAVGNVVGSNIFNLLLVLGASSMVLPIQSSLHTIYADLLFLGALTLACTWSLRRERRVGRTEGAAYLIGYLAFVCVLILGS